MATDWLITALAAIFSLMELAQRSQWLEPIRIILAFYFQAEIIPAEPNPARRYRCSTVPPTYSLCLKQPVKEICREKYSIPLSNVFSLRDCNH